MEKVEHKKRENSAMVFRGALHPELRAYITYLANDKSLSVAKISKKCNVSRATVYRYKKKELSAQKTTKRLGENCGGRPPKLQARDERKLLRALKFLRKEEGRFSSARIMEVAGITRVQVSVRTVRRFLNKHGYYYLQARRKGLLKETDLRQRVKFAKNMKKQYSRDVWKKHVAFYLDGVSFYHKVNPADQARAAQGHIWRKKCEGTSIGCTAKGKREGTGGRVAKFIVAISYNKGVIKCRQYEKLDGNYFASFVRNNFDAMFTRAEKENSPMWLQDGDPSQNSAVVRKVLHLKRAKLLSIPPRSPDINPIENFFNLIKIELRRQALQDNITRENYEAFSQRVYNTMINFPAEQIDKIIDTMNKRMDLIIKGNGKRTKY